MARKTPESDQQPLEANIIATYNFTFEDLKRLLNSESAEISSSYTTNYGNADALRIGLPLHNADLTTVSMYGTADKEHPRLLPRIEVSSGRWEHFSGGGGYFMPKDELEVVVDVVKEIQPVENGVKFIGQTGRKLTTLEIYADGRFSFSATPIEK